MDRSRGGLALTIREFLSGMWLVLKIYAVIFYLILYHPTVIYVYEGF